MVKVRGLGGMVRVRVRASATQYADESLHRTEVQGCVSLCVFVSAFPASVHLLMRETHKSSLV